MTSKLYSVLPHYLCWLARIVVALVFIKAASPKLIDPSQFAEDIRNYQVFPYWSWNVLAVTVPMIECTASIALLIGWKRRGAAIVLAALTCGFIALILLTISRDLNIDCGCFGQSNAHSTIGWPLVWRDLALFICILIAGIEPKTAFTAIKPK